jgi:steroid 5-alpha reductase family enzyme
LLYNIHSRGRQPGFDVRFDGIRTSPAKLYAAFLAQATWVCVSLLPVMAVNSLPRSTFAMQRIQDVPYRLRIPSEPYATDILGLTLFFVGFCFEGLTRRQTLRQGKAAMGTSLTRRLSTAGLWNQSSYSNYLAEVLLWSGLAASAGGLLARNPALAGLGLSGLRGSLTVVALCAASPVFTAFLLSEL